MLVGIVLAIAVAAAGGAFLVFTSARARANDYLTEGYPFATTGGSFSERSPGGRLGGKGAGMMVSADLRVAETLRRELRSIVAYLTGAALIATGIVLRNHLPFDGAFTILVGGVLILAAIYVPYVVAHLAPDITDELAEIESAFQAYNAEREQRLQAELRNLRETVAAVSAQLP